MTDIKLQALFGGLEYQELRAVQRRADWCRKEDNRTEEELRKYLNKATTTALAQNSLSDADLVEFLREEVLSLGPHRPETRIKRILQHTTIPEAVRQMSQKEIFLCGQLYGALRGELGSQYDVDQEHGVGDNRRLDLYIKHRQSGDEFLVEAKIADHLDSRMIKWDLRDRVRLYQKQLDQHERTYILLFFFTDRYWGLQSKEERPDIGSLWSKAKQDITSELPKSEIIPRVLPADWK